MNKKIITILLGAIPFLVIWVTWYLFYSFQIFPQWVIPSPSQTFFTFIHLIQDGTILHLILISFINIIPAFLIASIIAILLGVFIGTNSTVRKIFSPFISALYPIPSITWLPLVILFVGFTREAIWIVVFVSAFLRVIYNVTDGVRAINLNWILAGKNMGLNQFEIIYSIIIPGALPNIITGLRLGFASAWRSLIATEMLVASLGGLGKFIWYSQWTFSFDKVISGIIVIAVIGIAVEMLVFRPIERRTLIRWGMMREDKI
ncbi:MAG: ABC transporter permease subunit [Candidatus Paceibacterota bacterium]|jgi:NitT/TauT family transport system permease protein